MKKPRKNKKSLFSPSLFFSFFSFNLTTTVAPKHTRIKSITSPEIGDAPVVMSRTRPPSLALTFEKTSASQKAPAIPPPLRSPRASAALLWP